MNTELFLDLLGQTERDKINGKNRLNQLIPEWQTFLEFAEGIFCSRNVFEPIVVEIGILDGAQRRFYEMLLGASYISIDINPKAPATIKGDSGSPQVLEELKRLLNGRPIDLLFIDGLHTYQGVKTDYELYSPLVSHITAIHDILTPKNTPQDSVDVIRFWEELKATNTEDTLLTIQHYNPKPAAAFNGRPLGIGVVLKGQRQL
jgi:hypothetical protein